MPEGEPEGDGVPERLLEAEVDRLPLPLGELDTEGVPVALGDPDGDGVAEADADADADTEGLVPPNPRAAILMISSMDSLQKETSD